MTVDVKPTLKKAVEKVIDSYKKGQIFSGLELHREVSKTYPKAKTKYTDTILRTARLCRRDSYICVRRDKSLYKKVTK